MVVVSVVVVAGLVAAGVVVSGRGGTSSAPKAIRAPAPSPTPQVAKQLLSPFTGEPVKSLGRVLAMKIDNIAEARPPTGLTRADIVYLLPVEGGLSRILAVFSRHVPPVVGPVRSAREDDLELLRQFGRPAFAYSGAQPELVPVVHRARIVDLYAGTAGGYYRDPNRFAPHNLYAHTRQLVAEARGASTAHSIGFRFGPAPAGGTVTASASAAYSAASFTFRWSAPGARWLVWMDGSPAGTTEDGQLNAATVVIQYTTVRTSRFLEQGVAPPYAESTGSGSALVLRDGEEWHAHWARPSADGGTTFSTASGQPMTFARGQVWIVLAAR